MPNPVRFFRACVHGSNSVLARSRNGCAAANARRRTSTWETEGSVAGALMITHSFETLCTAVGTKRRTTDPILSTTLLRYYARYLLVLLFLFAEKPTTTVAIP